MTRPRARGFTVTELLVACVVLVALLAVCFEIVGASLSARRAASRRLIARQEAANLMERLAARPWDELTPELAAGLGLSPEGRAALPGAELAASVAAVEGEEAAKRISVEVRWKDTSSPSPRPERLVAWRYRLPAANPEAAP